MSVANEIGRERRWFGSLPADNETPFWSRGYELSSLHPADDTVVRVIWTWMDSVDDKTEAACIQVNIPVAYPRALGDTAGPHAQLSTYP
jgi:hypothetical protein